MNNASKGRCVTITPSDNSRETRLFVSQAQSENHYRAIFETLQDMEARSVVLPAGETVFNVGLTGTDWVGPKVHPVAWKIEIVATDGRLLGVQKSFLWEKPDK